MIQMVQPKESGLSIRFKNILRKYQDYLDIEKGHSPVTTSSKIRAIRRLLKASQTEHPIQLTEEVIRELFYRESKANDWSASCYCNYWSYLRCFFNWLILRGYIDIPYNPIERLARPKRPKLLPRRLTKDQLQQLFCECCTYPWRHQIERARNVAILATFIYTGIRINELLNILVMDVSRDKRSLLIRKGKGNKSRMVRIPTELKRFMDDYEVHLRRLGVRSEYYFSTVRKSTQMTHKDIYRIKDKLVKATGIPFTPHMLRHTFASISLERGISIAEISCAMGHESILHTQGYLAPEPDIMLSGFNNFSPFRF